MGGHGVFGGGVVCVIDVSPKEGIREVSEFEDVGGSDGSTVCSKTTSGAKDGVPARLVNSESSRSIGSVGSSSTEPSWPAPDSRCA